MATLFKEGDDMADVVFIVENKRLYFNQSVLAICSPVFKKEFSDSEKKKGTKVEIALPGKKYDNVVAFLEQIHPVYSVKPLTDDVLETLLALAKEYQVDHILQKCQQYIGAEIAPGKLLATDKLLLYLMLCEKYELSKHRSTLMAFVAYKDIDEFEAHMLFRSMTVEMQRDIMVAKCKQLKAEKDLWTL